MRYGLKYDEVVIGDHYIHGEHTKLGAAPLNPSGDWLRYTPADELQARSFETQTCTVFGTFNAIELLTKLHQSQNRLLILPLNYSERYTAILSGTDPNSGNTPHTVAETIRLKGAVPEHVLPFLDTNVAEFFSGISPDMGTIAELHRKALGFGHEWVFKPTDTLPKKRHKISQTLPLSPLGISVPAWHERDGFYYRPEGFMDNHWAVLVAETLDFDWVFDSYAPFLKKVRRDTNYAFCKRYSIGNPQALSLWDRLRAIIGL